LTNNALPAVCILAGGLGTRLRGAVRSTPKCLVEIAGRPFLDYQLEFLARYGISRAVLCVGHLGDQVEARIGPERYGLRIDYSYDGPKLDGTLGAIRRAAPLLGERFLVLYGDTYLRVDYGQFALEWISSGLMGGMTVLHNRGRWETSNAVYDAGHVLRYEKGTADRTMEWVDYGLGSLYRESLQIVGEDQADLAVLYAELAARRELFGYEATERFFEIGTPESLAETSTFLARATIRPDVPH
jgi:N-acetyl-alpha-D-muramate 1-phosphate uridylyltransferase